MSHLRLLILLAAGSAAFYLLAAQPLGNELSKGLALFIIIATLWVTELFHISVTALLVPVLATIFQIYPIHESLSHFAHPILFLFLGGFALGSAMQVHQIDRWIATRLLALAKGSILLSSFYIFGLTAFLSMWISNTATVAMIIPMVMGLLSNLDNREHANTYLYFLLGTAYSGAIGGMATLIGSPPNAIAASALGIGFSEWLRYGIPVATLSLPLVVGVLYLLLKPTRNALIEPPRIKFVFTTKAKLTLGIFLITVMAWTFGGAIGEMLSITSNMDTLIAIIALISLTATGCVSWSQISTTADWGVLILFGGGIALSSVLGDTGTSAYLAENVSEFVSNAPTFVFILMTITFVVFLTELASNTASAALLVPIFITISQFIGIEYKLLIIAIAFASSCAFMLPVATPPNALVFATGLVKQREMMRIGFWLNITMIGLITSLTYLFL